jgi:hypothetical protein
MQTTKYYSTSTFRKIYHDDRYDEWKKFLLEDGDAFNGTGHAQDVSIA